MEVIHYMYTLHFFNNYLLSIYFCLTLLVALGIQHGLKQAAVFLMVLPVVFSCGKTDNNQRNKSIMYQSMKSVMKKKHHSTNMLS